MSMSSLFRAKGSVRGAGALSRARLGAAGGLLVLACSAPLPAHGQLFWAQLIDMQNLTAAEWAQLPEYCAHTQTFHKGGPEYQRWIDRLGMGFSAMHHYCWGIIKAYRANTVAVGTQFQNSLLSDAVREIEYVVRNTPQDFILRPEVFLRGGQWAAMLGQHARALEYYQASVAAKPDYWPAYLEIANVNLAIRRRQHAIDALQLGLQHSPGQPALQGKLQSLERDRSIGAPRSQRP